MLCVEGDRGAPFSTCFRCMCILQCFGVGGVFAGWCPSTHARVSLCLGLVSSIGVFVAVRIMFVGCLGVYGQH
jgi:hypothetical protein